MPQEIRLLRINFTQTQDMHKAYHIYIYVQHVGSKDIIISTENRMS